jgi:hypothetical protein
MIKKTEPEALAEEPVVVVHDRDPVRPKAKKAKDKDDEADE